jgi:hypothetical protein
VACRIPSNHFFHVWRADCNHVIRLLHYILRMNTTAELGGFATGGTDTFGVQAQAGMLLGDPVTCLRCGAAAHFAELAKKAGSDGFRPRPVSRDMLTTNSRRAAFARQAI